MIFNALCMHLDSGQMARSGKRTIVHCPRGIPRLWEEFTAVFPQWTRSAYRLNSPTLGKDIYRESNGTKTQRNRSQSLQKPQWRQVNRQRSSGKDFFTDNPFVFSNWRKKRFFPIQILIILPLHNDQRSAGLISHIAWGTCGKLKWISWTTKRDSINLRLAGSKEFGLLLKLIFYNSIEVITGFPCSFNQRNRLKTQFHAIV